MKHSVFARFPGALAAAIALAMVGMAVAAPPVDAATSPKPSPTCSPIPGLSATPPPGSMQTPPPGSAAMTPAISAAVQAGTAAATANGSVGNVSSLTPSQFSQLAALAKSLCPSPAPVVPTSSEAAAIYAAAERFIGTNTSALFGAAGGWGTEACMFSVNQILQNALGKTLAGDTGYVPNGVAALQAGGGVQISQSEAQPGDIAVADGEGHIGICLNVGCTQVISNSSSNGSFTWVSNGNFAPSYTGPSTFYQVTL
jgi:cell wall-associated NlpC family hydrolase